MELRQAQRKQAKIKLALQGVSELVYNQQKSRHSAFFIKEIAIHSSNYTGS